MTRITTSIKEKLNKSERQTNIGKLDLNYYRLFFRNHVNDIKEYLFKMEVRLFGNNYRVAILRTLTRIIMFNLQSIGQF